MIVKRPGNTRAIAHGFLAVALTAVAIVCHAQTENNGAKVKTEQQESFYVIGLSVRTINSTEVTGNGNIPKLWQRFMSEDWAAKIPNRTDDKLLAVYSDYASDENGEYTYTVAARVSSIDHVPEGMTTKTVPAGRFAVLTSAKGPLSQVIPQMWKNAYRIPPSELGGVRAFAVDYEVYDQRAADPQNAQVELHLGVK